MLHLNSCIVRSLEYITSEGQYHSCLHVDYAFIRLLLLPTEVRIWWLKFGYHCLREHGLNIQQIFGVHKHGISQGGGFEEELGEKNEHVTCCRWFRCIGTLIQWYWWNPVTLYHNRKTSYSFPALCKDCKRKLLTALFGGNSCPVHSLGVILAGEHKLVSFLYRYFKFEEHPGHLQTYHSTRVTSTVYILIPGLADDYFACHPLCDPHLNLLRN